VQSEGSPIAFTEVTGRELISDAGLCSMQGSIVGRGVTRSGQFFVSIFSYIYTTELCRAHQYTGGGMQGRISSIMRAIALNLTTQSDVRNFGTEVQFWSRYKIEVFSCVVDTCFAKCLELPDLHTHT